MNEVERTELTFPMIQPNKKRKAKDRNSIDAAATRYKKKQNATAVDLIETIEALTYKLEKLNQKVNESINTKREIKDLNTDLQKIGKHINKISIKNMLEEIRWDKTEIITMDVDSQTDFTIDSLLGERQLVSREEFEEKLTWDRAATVIRKTWTKNSYRRVKTRSGNPLLEKKEKNIAIITSLEDAGKNTIVKDLLQKRTQFKGIIEENRIPTGKIVYVKASETVVVEEDTLEGEEEDTSYTYLLGVKTKDIGKGNGNEIFEGLSKLATAAETPNKNSGYSECA